MSERLQRVIGNYEEKLRLGVAGRLSEEEIRRRVDNYAVAAVEQDCILQQVRFVLGIHDVPTIHNPFYHSFSCELSRLNRTELSMESRQFEFVVIMAKWVMRGLTQSVLKDIGLTVFNLQAPAAPDAE
jgi:hypothetical protein